MPVLRIRKAVDDSKTVAKTDTTLLYTAVRAAPNAPRGISVDSIGRQVAEPNFVCFIDEPAPPSLDIYIAGLDVQEVAQQVEVVWWLPRAAWDENNMLKLLPVLAEALAEVMKQWPGSGTWSIAGTLPGVGDTDSARRRNSYEIVGAWVDLLNSTPAGVIADRVLNPYNRNQFRPVCTVQKMADFIVWAAAQP